jgi:DNA modification methylase
VVDPILLIGDCRETLRTLPDASVNCCVTSPPYFGLRDYGHDGQIGLEQTPDDYVAELVAVFREVRRVLRDDGTVFLNLGDSYASNPASGGAQSEKMTGGEHKRTPAIEYKRPPGLKPKDLIGIPWRVAFALQADKQWTCRSCGDARWNPHTSLCKCGGVREVTIPGWYLRQDIIWHKPNPMPESVTDRCTKAHEYIFLLSKSAKYWYDAEAIAEPATYSQITGMDGSGFKPPQNFNGKHSGGSETLPQRKNVQGPDNGTRNKRSVWTVATKPYSGAHFATFPPNLIEPCIMAGCPSKACAECGAPWERVVERGSTYNGKRDTGQTYTARAYASPQSEPRGRKKNLEGDAKPVRYLGHRPTCTCNTTTKPGTVLDPFNGAGTTGLVAIQQGRQYIGCELNPEYAELSLKRWGPELAQPKLELGV